MSRIARIARFDPYAASWLLVAVLLSVWGSVLAVLLLGTSRLYSVPLIAATAFPLVLYGTRNPRLFCLVAMVFSAPFGLSINFHRVVHIGGAPSFSIDVADFFLVPLIIFLIRDYAAGRRDEIRFSGISAWWLGLMAIGAGAIVVGPYREFSAYEFVRMLKCWLLFLVIINECVREKQFRYVVMALVANAGVNLFVAALQFVLRHELGLQALGEAAEASILGANLGVYLEAGSVYRVSGLIGHPNLYSAYLALLTPLFVAMTFGDYRWSTRLLLGATSFGGGIALVATLSRTGWADFAVAFAVLLAALVVHPALRRRHAGLKALLVAVAALGALGAAGTILRRITASDSGALDFRYEWIVIAWHMVQAKPLFGFGLNTFVYHLAEFAPYSIGKMIDLFGKVWPPVHNIYFLVWAEQGTVGLLLFLGMFAHLFWIGVATARRACSQNMLLLTIGAMCGLLGIVVDGFGSFYLRVPAPARVFWIVAGLLVAARYWNNRNAPLRTDRSPAASATTAPGAPATTG